VVVVVVDVDVEVGVRAAVVDDSSCGRVVAGAVVTGFAEP